MAWGRVLNLKAKFLETTNDTKSTKGKKLTGRVRTVENLTDSSVENI
jgi:hypothetical protein